MQIHGSTQMAGDPPAPSAPGRYRRMIMVGAGTLVLVLTTIGTVAAMGGRSPTTPTTIAKAPQSPSDQVPGPTTGVTTIPTAAGPVLADGTYPTYVSKVDVQRATITVDVIQVFQDEAAANAAIEDGTPSSEAQYLYIYIRNQNPLLRTLPVARDVRIDFLGTCESPGNREAALTELAKKTKHFDATYYYDVTVKDGAIHQITQRVATAAC
jgi:hypothetical protein